MAPIRVLHMIGSLNMGGSQVMIMNLYRIIDRGKIQFDFIVDHPDDLYFADEIKKLGGRIYLMPTFKGTNILSVIRAWDKFFKEHKFYRIFHTHVRSYASLYMPIAKKYGLVTIAHSHNTANGGGIASITKNILQYPLRFQADYFFACSKPAGEWLFGKKVIESDRFYILKNAIDSANYCYSEDARKRIREELGISESCFVVGHVGRFHPQKNHSFLIDVFSIIHDNEKNSVLLLVGDGVLRGDIENKVEKLGLTKNVILAGVRSDIPELLSAMDTFVFPSLFEGLGIVAIEAQASGLPIVCSDVVPKETEITDLIKYISLDSPIEEWSNCIMRYFNSAKRSTPENEITKSGYDIYSTVAWIERFYSRLSSGKMSQRDFD